jgi:SAM-dependent methyltransferase
VISRGIGYTAEELGAIPDGANLGLGCGNPVALASIKEGETVLDLGAGAGMDVFLAATKVGKTGKVIGVDMTPDMIERSRAIAKREKYANVEFRLGEIEALPVADGTVDAIISNCVINLSPDKPRVFKEAFRVLKPGGRLMVSDLVLLSELPDVIKKSASAYVSCVAGAALKKDYLGDITKAGFKDVRVVEENPLPLSMLIESPELANIIATAGVSAKELTDVMHSVLSVRVHAVKP